MLRRFAPALVLLTGVVLLVIPSQAPAATTHTVQMHISGFSPQNVTALQGDTVTWKNGDTLFSHTSTSNQGFWKSPLLSGGQSYSQTAAFMNAGNYAYHCTQHANMTGTVRVPLIATGTSSAGYTLRWSSLTSTPTTRSFDVQIKRPGSTTWAGFRTGTTSRRAFFNPARAGQYAFRARTDILPGTKHSDWSPVLTLTIT